jgi:phosphopantetheinyl transferase
MISHLCGPYRILPDCRLWLAKNQHYNQSPDIEISKEIAEAHLSPDEMDRWNRYRPISKKLQFLFSRVAIRDVLVREFGEDSRGMFFNTVESGEPQLNDAHGNRMASISVSHSENLTAILLSTERNKPGVDLEVLQSVNVRSFGFSFVNDFEYRWIRRESFIDCAEVMLAIWTLKESLWKAMGGQKESSLQDIVVDYQNSTLIAETRNMNLQGKNVTPHFFGQHYTFPGQLRNYSSLDIGKSFSSRFIGCVVNLSPDIEHR